MYKKVIYPKSSIQRRNVQEGEPIEHKVERIQNNKEPIKDGAPLLYTERKDGSALFYYNDDKYKIDVSFSDISNAIGLDFVIAIKETIDGKSEWFEAQKEEDGSYKKCDGRRKIRNSLLKRGKTIPFNQSALDTLNMAQEKFRQLSETLFNFINQDEEQIMLTLTNNRLLN